jgi:hypothetical protein
LEDEARSFRCILSVYGYFYHSATGVQIFQKDFVLYPKWESNKVGLFSEDFSVDFDGDDKTILIHHGLPFTARRLEAQVKDG